jgi:hypothetical protein
MPATLQDFPIITSMQKIFDLFSLSCFASPQDAGLSAARCKSPRKPITFDNPFPQKSPTEEKLFLFSASLAATPSSEFLLWDTS